MNTPEQDVEYLQRCLAMLRDKERTVWAVEYQRDGGSTEYDLCATKEIAYRVLMKFIFDVYDGAFGDEQVKGVLEQLAAGFDNVELYGDHYYIREQAIVTEYAGRPDLGLGKPVNI